MSSKIFKQGISWMVFIAKGLCTLHEHQKNLTFATVSKNSDKDVIMGIYEKNFQCSEKSATFS